MTGNVACFANFANLSANLVILTNFDSGKDFVTQSVFKNYYVKSF